MVTTIVNPKPMSEASRVAHACPASCTRTAHISASTTDGAGKMKVGTFNVLTATSQRTSRNTKVAAGSRYSRAARPSVPTRGTLASGRLGVAPAEDDASDLICMIAEFLEPLHRHGPRTRQADVDRPRQAAWARRHDD